ncbi:MAG: hypothetical protein ACP5Q4_10050, partial [Candidatus Caldatribacteriaceae bacterium]
MKKWFGIFVVLVVFSLSPLAWALLAKTVLPEEACLTVYQGVDRAWMEGLFWLSLFAGENQVLLPRKDATFKRFLVKPLSGGVELLKLESTPQGQRLTLKSPREGQYPVLLGFFLPGFDWEALYVAHLGERELALYPSVLLKNQSAEAFRNLTISWLLGTPIFEEERIAEDEVFMEMVAKRAAQVPAPPPQAPIQTERVSEYVLFTLPEKVDFPNNATIQVFPSRRTLPTETVVRYQDGNVVRLLIVENQGDPLPPGVLFLHSEGTVMEIPFPGIRQGEKREFILPLWSGVSLQKEVRQFFREEAYFNEDKEVVGFRAFLEVAFEVENETEKELTLEIRESLLTQETPELPSGW